MANEQSPESLAETAQKGFQAAEDLLRALKETGAIHGYALAVQRDVDGGIGHEVSACCPGHMADMLEPEMLLESDDMGVVLAVTEKLTKGLTDAVRGPEGAPQSLAEAIELLGFRESYPAPRDPQVSAEEFRQALDMDGGYL